MRFDLHIARKYLYGPKSTNAINLITGISVIGISIGTAALVLILSVFNGFEALMKTYLDRFNPDYKIVASEGKFFDETEFPLHELKQIKDIVSYSKVIEEVALFDYDKRQQVGIIKGVDENYLRTTSLDETIIQGDSKIKSDDQQNFVVVGSGVSDNLQISINNSFEFLKIYLPNRKKRGPLDKDFKSRSASIAGIFSIQNDRDNQYVIADYEMVSSLLDMSGRISAIELKLDANGSITELSETIKKLDLSDKFLIQNRYQQDESFLKIMNIEKWSSYLIFSFTLLLIIFNVIGCLWMIVLDKKKDIAVMQSFGVTKNTVRRIFINEGLLISGIGFGIGLFFSLVFYILQKNYGLITVPDGFSISSYPMEVEFLDVGIVFITVMSLGFLASFPAAYRASRVSAYVRNE